MVLVVRVAIIILLGMAAAPAMAQQRIALLIGNQSYDATVGPLQNPHNDIRAVGAALKRQGFELLPEVKDARRSTILGAVRQLRDRLIAAGNGAVGFVYYSGHGAAESDTGINYIIPVDAKNPGSTEFWDESLKLDDILKLLDGARGAAKFIVFDACRNELRVPAKSTTKGLIPVAEQQGMLIAYATSPGRTASDIGQGSGPFAAALAAELSKPGLDHLNLFQNVKETVLATTKGVQQPWVNDGLARRVYLTGEPQPARITREQVAQEAALAWTAIKDSTSVAALEAFRRRFDGTAFADFATARLDDLKRGTAVSKAEAERMLAELERETARLAELNRKGLTSKTETERSGAGLTKQSPATCDGVIVKAEGDGRTCIKPGSGKTTWFKDCPTCPELVAIPAGHFMMGSPADEPGRFDDETQVEVLIPKPFAIGRTSVTFAEWDACVAAGGCGGHRPSDGGAGRGRNPVINVSHDDVQAYVNWLRAKTGEVYRLPTEAEREYAARAGTTGAYSFAGAPEPVKANYGDPARVAAARTAGAGVAPILAPADSFLPNAWGLHNVHGNVQEWTSDCWQPNRIANKPSPADTNGPCERRTVKGGSWLGTARMMRSAARDSARSVDRGPTIGFRVVREFSTPPIK